jgi:transcriptional regulator with XRE-family HTH domain
MRRFDTIALFNALDEQRKSRNMTWKQVADEIRVSQSTIMRTQSGSRLEVDGMLQMVAWLNVAVEYFVRETKS